MKIALHSEVNFEIMARELSVMGEKSEVLYRGGGTRDSQATACL